ncbi:hypothetical protein ACHFCA_23335 [Delftia tsuruhatensis]
MPFAVITQRHAACQFQCRIDLYMAMLHQCHAKHPVLVAPRLGLGEKEIQHIKAIADAIVGIAVLDTVQPVLPA